MSFWLDLFVVLALFVPIVGEVVIPQKPKKTSKHRERKNKDGHVSRVAPVDVVSSVEERQDRAA